MSSVGTSWFYDSSGVTSPDPVPMSGPNQSISPLGDEAGSPRANRRNLVLKLSGPGGVGRRRVDITNTVSVFRDDGESSPVGPERDASSFLGLYHPTNPEEAARYLSDARSAALHNPSTDTGTLVVEGDGRPERRSRKARQLASHVDSRIKHQHRMQMDGFMESQRGFVAKYAARLAEEEAILADPSSKLDGSTPAVPLPVDPDDELPKSPVARPQTPLTPAEEAFRERRRNIEARHAALQALRTSRTLETLL